MSSLFEKGVVNFVFKSNESNQDIFTLLNKREVKKSTQKTRTKKK